MVHQQANQPLNQILPECICVGMQMAYRGGSEVTHSKTKQPIWTVKLGSYHAKNNYVKR